MAKRHKIAISVSSEVYREAEALRKKTGETRSAVYERAVAGLLSERRRKELTQQYLNGYRRRPETRSEIEVAQATALTSLGGERWDETG